MLKTTTLAVLVASAAGAATAGSPAPVDPEPVIAAPAAQSYSAAPSWEGGYVGGQIGYAYGEFDPSLNPNDFNENSVIGGLNAGYLWGFGNGWYAGPEFQYDFADLTVTDPNTGNTASFDEMARLKLLLGHEMGNGLLYGSAGLAYADMNGVNSFFDGSDTGYVVGVGYDWRVADNWTVGVEYQYHDFDDIGNNGGDVAVNTLHAKTSFRF